MLAGQCRLRGVLRSTENQFLYPRQWAGATMEQFVAELDEYIRWYNETRIKMSFGGRSPVEYRQSLGIAA